MREDMNPRICPACGALALIQTMGTIIVPLRGEKQSVAGFAHDACQECGERPLTAKQMDELLVLAADEAQRARGLMGPSDVRDLRLRLGLSQRALEKVLGTGEKTVVRWENGTVFPSATANNLMRLLWQDPKLVDQIGSAPTTICQPVASDWVVDVGNFILSAPTAAPQQQEVANREYALAA